MGVVISALGLAARCAMSLQGAGGDVSEMLTLSGEVP